MIDPLTRIVPPKPRAIFLGEGCTTRSVLPVRSWRRGWRPSGVCCERPYVLRVLPDGCMDLNGDDVVGSLTSALMAKLEAGDETSGVRLRPGAFTALYGVPADELSDLRVPLADATLSVLSATRVTQPPAGVSEDQWAHRRRRAAVP